MRFFGDQPVLQQGSSGAAVTLLQQDLTAAGFGPAIDGQFGPETLNAVQTFQSQNSLPATGIVDAATWNALAQYGSAPGSTASGANAPTSPLAALLGGGSGGLSWQAILGLSIAGVGGLLFVVWLATRRPRPEHPSP